MTAPVALHFVDEGPRGAPVLLMSHSLGASLDMWEPQAAALSRRPPMSPSPRPAGRGQGEGPGLRVIRVDLRAHGRSPAPPGPYEIADLGGDLIAVLDHLGVARAHLCGLSLGGMASMWAAAHRPERVDRLVVCCTSARLGPPEAWAARAAAVRAGGTEAVADTIVARWFTAPFAALHPDLVAKLRAGIAATGADGYIACCGALERMDLRADIRSIRAPALAVAGADDPSTPPEHLRAIAAAIPGCRLEVVAQAAHLANLEQPEKVTALIANHLGATA